MEQVKKDILKYLKQRNFMSVATRSKEIWNTPVYYSIDNEMNLYFISDPNTVHCRNIYKNGEVACTVADTNQKVTAKKIGVQLWGSASEVHSANKIKHILSLWNKANPGVATVINLPNIIKKVISSRVFQIKPKRIQFFNEELYGSEGLRVVNL